MYSPGGLQLAAANFWSGSVKKVGKNARFATGAEITTEQFDEVSNRLHPSLLNCPPRVPTAMRLTPEQRLDIEKRIAEIDLEIPLVQNAIAGGASLSSSLDLLHYERAKLKRRLAEE